MLLYKKLLLMTFSMTLVVLLKNLISAALTLDQSNSRPGVACVFYVYTVRYVL